MLLTIVEPLHEPELRLSGQAIGLRNLSPVHIVQVHVCVPPVSLSFGALGDLEVRNLVAAQVKLYPVERVDDLVEIHSLVKHTHLFWLLTTAAQLVKDLLAGFCLEVAEVEAKSWQSVLEGHSLVRQHRDPVLAQAIVQSLKALLRVQLCLNMLDSCRTVLGVGLVVRVQRRGRGR